MDRQRLRGTLIRRICALVLSSGLLTSGCVREVPPAETSVVSRDTAPPKFTDSIVPLSGAPVVVPAFDYGAMMFLADQDSSGRLCIASPERALEIGTPVTVIFPGFPQRFVTGRVGRLSKLSCSHLGATPLDTLEYALDAPGDTIGSGPGIAIIGRFPPAVLRGDTVTMALEAGQPPARFRSCASTEGLHITAWAGVPLRSRRLWHAYYYVGYDLEPDCNPADYAADGGSAKR